MEMYSTSYHGKENLQNFSFLITGGAGFIGSNLAEYLVKYGAKKVRVLDNLSTGFEKNIEDFKIYRGFEFIEGDIRDIEICKKAMIGIDYVFHQAALGSVIRSIKDPITTNEVNVNGFINIAISARDEKVKRIIYASSSSTYGDNTEVPKVEENIGKPLSPYAITKNMNESYADVFHKLYGLELIGLRYFNVFGQRQSPSGAYAAVIPMFVGRFLNYKSPVINGDGKFSRDFTYIDNVVQANIKAAFATNPDCINQVFNIAFGESTTLDNLILLIKENLMKYDKSISNIETIYAPKRIGDVPYSLASIDKAKKMLGYSPQFSVLQGLKEAIRWYVSHKETIFISSKAEVS